MGKEVLSFTPSPMGPIACGVSELAQIVTGILGWETVTNAAGGDAGANQKATLACARTGATHWRSRA